MHWKTLTYVCFHLSMIQCFSNITCSQVKLEKSRRGSALEKTIEVSKKNGISISKLPLSFLPSGKEYSIFVTVCA